MKAGEVMVILQNIAEIKSTGKKIVESKVS